MRGLHTQVVELRQEVSGLRQEVGGLRQDVGDLRERVVRIETVLSGEARIAPS